MANLYKKLYGTCAQEGLKAWECPNFVFTIMGVATIGIMAMTYFISREYFTLEMVAFSMMIVSVLLLVLGYFISNGVRRLSKAKLLAEKEKARTTSIIGHLSDGLIMLDRHCKVSLVNPRAEKLLGIKEKDVMGIDIRKKKQSAALKQFLSVAHWCPGESKKITNEVFREEISILKPRPRILKVKTSYVQNYEGQRIGFIKVLHDVTQEKQLEEIKSDFISIASHQLKTPLSTIKWNLEILKKAYSKKSTPEEINLIDRTCDANEDMIEVIRDLLNISKIEQGKAKLDLESTSLTESINTVVKKLQLFASKKNVKVISKLPVQDIKFFLDRSAIEIVINNILDNAIKYTPPRGQITVNLNYEPESHPQFAVVSITDTGPGISSADRQQLFKKFFRSRRIIKKTKGTGLGLYIAKNIVDLHGGSFHVKSTEGKGSTFSFSLPLRFSK